MLKCKYDECRWPSCEKTCGLVPDQEAYIRGERNETALIEHLQTEIRNLKLRNTSAKIFARRVMSDAQRTIDILSDPDYERVCPYGYMDCAYDPGYLRKYHTETWEKMGMPTTCGETCGGKDGGYSNEYDWEGK